MNEYCYVMDYSDGTICEIKIVPEDNDENGEIDVDNLFAKYGLKTSNCSWMLTTSKIENIIELN
nr:MAG TPA: hypothetical protein [Crassvirales sp.]